MASALELEEAHRKWLRCAALLHDIGHYPLSHTGERVYSNLETPRAPVIEETSPVGPEQDPFIWAANLDPTRRQFSHEAISQHIVHNNENIAGILKAHHIPLDSVAAIIDGELHDAPDAAIYNALMKSELDADRMDYLVRDATLVGAKYGLIDADYLLEELHIWRSATERRLGVREKGLHSLEHALLSRFFMYCNVFHQKTVVGFDLLARAIMRPLILDGNTSTFPTDPEKVKEMAVDKDPQAFLRFTDNIFWHGVSVGATSSQNARLSQLCRMLQERRGPKCVYSIEKVLGKEDRKDPKQLQRIQDALNDSDRRSELAKEAHIPADDIALWVDDIPLLKEEDADDAIHIIRDTPGKEPVAFQHLEASLLSRHVGEKLRRALVFFLDDPPSAKDDPESTRNRVKQLIEEIADSD